MRLTDVRRYPVKSCGGESVTSAVLEPWGLEGDRRWMLVDPDGGVVTAREVNHLLLVRPAITPTGLRLSAPGRPDLGDLDVAFPEGQPVPVRVWRSSLVATPADDDAHAWFSAVTGRDVRLVWLDDPTRRHPNPDFARAEDLVSLADGYPLLLTTEASLAALNDALPDALPDQAQGQAQGRAQGQAQPMAMVRFRANVVVSGAQAWAEDDWRRVRIGDAVLRAVKGCERCVMTTIDPLTAERGKEPIASLATLRRFDGGTWFGVNLVPDTPGVTIRVGDVVDVLDAVEPGGGPVRAG